MNEWTIWFDVGKESHEKEYVYLTDVTFLVANF